MIPNNTSSWPVNPPDSRLTVLEDGEVEYRVSSWKICSKEGAKNGPDCSWWPFRWDDAHEQVFQGKLDGPALDHLRTLLNRDDIKGFSGYANAGPGVGEFRISIDREKGRQLIAVIGFNPQYGWQPPLTDLICEAKTIAQYSSKSETLPPWCNGHPSK
jgi:hypothetical protein